MNNVRIAGLDHLVLTVADAQRTIDFYERVLGMESITFGDGRQALLFGPSKINLHVVGHEIRPHAAHPVAGSADLCLLTESSPGDVVEHLNACGIPVEEGPVARTGARGPILSSYVRDPDGNLIEIGTYDVALSS